MVITLTVSGQNPTGQNPTGQNTYGQNPTRQNPTGQSPQHEKWTKSYNMKGKVHGENLDTLEVLNGNVYTCEKYLMF